MKEGEITRDGETVAPPLTPVATPCGDALATPGDGSVEEIIFRLSEKELRAASNSASET